MINWEWNHQDHFAVGGGYCSGSLWLDLLFGQLSFSWGQHD